MPTSKPLEDDLAAALAAAVPERDRLVEAARPHQLYLVGGAVRDLLLGAPRSDVDLVTEGDPAAIAARLGGEVTGHERFATARVLLGGGAVDLARARSERYQRPGALPVVSPATLTEDLARRDFTINAMAVQLQGETRLIDLHGGRDDLEAGRLRALHDRSFSDDPTRALRAARYAARFGFHPEPETARLLLRTDLETVSGDRRLTELLRIAAEPRAPRAFDLLARWGLLDLRPGGVELAARVGELLRRPPWVGFTDPDRAVLAAATGPAGAEAELVSLAPGSPAEGVDLAVRHDPVELAIARAMGALWLDQYVGRWRAVELEISGDDLLAAGVPEGPAIGNALAVALRRKLDGEIGGREEELAAALEAASDG